MTQLGLYLVRLLLVTWFVVVSIIYNDKSCSSKTTDSSRQLFEWDFLANHDSQSVLKVWSNRKASSAFQIETCVDFLMIFLVYYVLTISPKSRFTR